MKIINPLQLLWTMVWAYIFTLAFFGLVSSLSVSASNIWDVDIPAVTSEWDINAAAASVGAFLVLVCAFRNWVNKE
jgi:hypothetical protein